MKEEEIMPSVEANPRSTGKVFKSCTVLEKDQVTLEAIGSS